MKLEFYANVCVHVTENESAKINPSMCEYNLLLYACKLLIEILCEKGKV